MDWRKTGAITGAIGVAAGAFGAHWLKGRLSQSLFEAYQTAVLYHLLHAIVLVGVGLFAQRENEITGERSVLAPAIQRSAALLLAGIVLFSGSLYALCLTGLRVFAFATPVGGSLLIAGWLVLALGPGVRSKRQS